jgi:uncharacterized protein YdeI (YjbR/CyaY-like superfamily)
MKKINLKKTGKESGPKAGAEFLKALADAPKAKAMWQDITPIGRRDFIRWIEGAKQAETRSRRIKVACSKLVAGQRRPCCYAVVPLNLYTALNANPKAKAVWKDLTPDARRDFVDFIDSAKDSQASKIKVEKVCLTLAAGKKHP